MLDEVSERSGAAIVLSGVAAVIFDMDGVVTDTAGVHAAAWKQLFDEFLQEHASPFVPFDERDDYLRYVDGKARADGVRDFLASRGISLPEGSAGDPGTVQWLGAKKNAAFIAALEARGARPFESTVALIRELRLRGVRTGVISASRNMPRVLAKAGLTTLFEAHVDGNVAAERALPGKPEPAVFLEAARALGVEPSGTVVVEDAIAGVEAGRKGGFAVVVGVDRGNHADALRDAGADIVVPDLARLAIDASRPIRDVPSALEAFERIAERVGDAQAAVFLDYDGTLTPIVSHPAEAMIDATMRDAVAKLARMLPVGILSGRDLEDVRSMAGVDGIVYAGSHGFDILTPDGTSHRRGEQVTGALDDAERILADALQPFDGVWVERKRFAIAVHYRQADPAVAPALDEAVTAVATRVPSLRKTGGKKIFELRPSIAWDKGKALMLALETLRASERTIPIYVGDDETDEDAFRVLQRRGIGVVVRGEDDERPTVAHLALASTSETRILLERLAAHVEARS